jgi:hypothetical protein
MVSGCGSDALEPAAVERAPVLAPIVIVLNGCGVTGSARQVAESVRAIGYDVGNGHGENADSFDYPKTLVVDYVGQPATARKLARRLGCPAIQQISHDPDQFGGIGVVVGADFRERLATLNRS